MVVISTDIFRPKNHVNQGPPVVVSQRQVAHFLLITIKVIVAALISSMVGSTNSPERGLVQAPVL